MSIDRTIEEYLDREVERQIDPFSERLRVVEERVQHLYNVRDEELQAEVGREDVRYGEVGPIVRSAPTSPEADEAVHRFVHDPPAPTEDPEGMPGPVLWAHHYDFPEPRTEYGKDRYPGDGVEWTTPLYSESTVRALVEAKERAERMTEAMQSARDLAYEQHTRLRRRHDEQVQRFGGMEDCIRELEEELRATKELLADREENRRDLIALLGIQDELHPNVYRAVQRLVEEKERAEREREFWRHHFIKSDDARRMAERERDKAQDMQVRMHHEREGFKRRIRELEETLQEERKADIRLYNRAEEAIQEASRLASQRVEVAEEAVIAALQGWLSDLSQTSRVRMRTALRCAAPHMLTRPATGEEVRVQQRRYSCGCVSCVCEDDEQCQGCGAKSCEKLSSECVWRSELRGEEEQEASGESVVGYVSPNEWHRYSEGDAWSLSVMQGELESAALDFTLPVRITIEDPSEDPPKESPDD